MDLRLKISKILCIILLFSLGFSQQVIAVSNISSDGLSKFQQKQLYNTLESALVNLGAYEVTSRQEIDKILEEQKFQKSGCTDQQCAAEIGRMLNADLMLLSEILFEESSGDISITLKLVDVETAKIVTAVNKYESINKIQDIFDKIPSYLLELYRNQNKDRSMMQTPTQSKKEVGRGKLIIRSNPIGARISVDNTDLGLTPIEKEIDAGRHRLILTYEGYERFSQYIIIETSKTETVEAELVPLTGDLSILSDPPGSDVHVNDEYRGQTPLVLQYLDVGEYFIKLSQVGYYDELSKVNVEWSQENIFKKTLRSLPGSVAFYSVPNGAQVFVDGNSKGFTTISGLVVELPSGKYKITMKMEGYNTERKEIELKPGEYADMELAISKIQKRLSEDPNLGWISFNGAPSKSQVVLQGKSYNTPLRYHELNKGMYSAKIKMDGYISQTLSFEIRPQKHSELDFMLESIDKKTALKKGWMFPGSGHYYAENQKKGNFFRYLTLASLVFTTKSYLDYSNALKAEDNAYLAYKNAVDQDDIDSKAQIYRDESAKISENLILLGTGGGVTTAIWIYNVIHLNKFLSPDNLSYENSNLNIGITPNGRLQAQITF